MDRAERLEILGRIARGEETEEKLGKEGPVQCTPAIRDRLAAIRMLAELEGDIERAKRKAASPDDGDEFAGMAPDDLRREALKDPKLRQLSLTWKGG